MSASERKFSMRQLLDLLTAKGLLWSYDPERVAQLPDHVIIEHTLAYGDVPELKLLFGLYHHTEIKKIWEERMLPDERMRSANRYLGQFFFQIADIDEFLNHHVQVDSRLEKLRLLAAKDPGSAATAV